MAKAIHSMIRVLDEEKSRSFYKSAFGLDVADRLDFDNFTLVYLRNSETDFELELTINKGRTEPYDLGDGYGHLAFSVDDLDAEHVRHEGTATQDTRYRGIQARRHNAGAVLFRRRSGWLQDRGFGTTRPVFVRPANGVGGTPSASKGI